MHAYAVIILYDIILVRIHFYIIKNILANILMSMHYTVYAIFVLHGESLAFLHNFLRIILITCEYSAAISAVIYDIVLYRCQLCK